MYNFQQQLEQVRQQRAAQYQRMQGINSPSSFVVTPPALRPTPQRAQFAQSLAPQSPMIQSPAVQGRIFLPLAVATQRDTLEPPRMVSDVPQFDDKRFDSFYNIGQVYRSLQEMKERFSVVEVRGLMWEVYNLQMVLVLGYMYPELAKVAANYFQTIYTNASADKMAMYEQEVFGFLRKVQKYANIQDSIPEGHYEKIEQLIVPTIGRQKYNELLQFASEDFESQYWQSVPVLTEEQARLLLYDPRLRILIFNFDHRTLLNLLIPKNSAVWGRVIARSILAISDDIASITATRGALNMRHNEIIRASLKKELESMIDEMNDQQVDVFVYLYPGDVSFVNESNRPSAD